MMKALFYIFSLLPKSFFIYLVDLYLYTRIYKLFSSYKITKINLEIAYPDLKKNDILLISKLSIRESIISGFETLYTWGRDDYESNAQIFKITNNFLLNKLYSRHKGLIAVSIHNRSVDMILKWINSNIKTTSLYKKVKIKSLERFVKKDRESGGSIAVETSISGVRKILKALRSQKAICFAADQVPQRGLGEYIKLYNRDAYTTTLVQTLATKTNAPVLYFYLNSNKDNFLSITLKQCNSKIYDDSKHKLLLNQDIEKIINTRPIDYSWEYKRFKKARPPDKDPYKVI
ncbi:MAG: lipid A biosynthesis lauroyl acyltransferase [Gammaproteobacteria bacterium]|nr:lipid A biosynthesis lauroyl acyltransferase [Gammaproteobacteria bacterium]